MIWFRQPQEAIECITLACEVTDPVKRSAIKQAEEDDVTNHSIPSTTSAMLLRRSQHSPLTEAWFGQCSCSVHQHYTITRERKIDTLEYFFSHLNHIQLSVPHITPATYATETRRRYQRVRA